MQDSKGNTTLHKAISRDNKKLITLLIEAGASFKNNDGMTPIFEVTNRGYKDSIKKAYKNLRTDLYKIHLLNANNKIPTEIVSQIVLAY